jgi:hypothetical protein
VSARPVDVESLLVAWLKRARDGVSVSTKVPNPRPSEFVRVRRMGGTRRNLVQEQALIFIECWGPSDYAAFLLAQDVWAWMDALDGEPWCHSTGLASPLSNSDPDTGQDRYTFTANMLVNLTVS